MVLESATIHLIQRLSQLVAGYLDADDGQCRGRQSSSHAPTRTLHLCQSVMLLSTLTNLLGKLETLQKVQYLLHTLQ